MGDVRCVDMNSIRKYCGLGKNKLCGIMCWTKELAENMYVSELLGSKF